MIIIFCLMICFLLILDEIPLAILICLVALVMLNLLLLEEVQEKNKNKRRDDD